MAHIPTITWLFLISDNISKNILQRHLQVLEGRRRERERQIGHWNVDLQVYYDLNLFVLVLPIRVLHHDLNLFSLACLKIGT